MTDNLAAYYRAMALIKRVEHRNRLRQEIDDVLRVARAAKAAGLTMRATTIVGIPFEFCEPARAAEAKEADDEVEAWIAKHRRSDHAR
jgi:hypothetical protein